MGSGQGNSVTISDWHIFAGWMFVSFLFLWTAARAHWAWRTWRSSTVIMRFFGYLALGINSLLHALSRLSYVPVTHADTVNLGRIFVTVSAVCFALSMNEYICRKMGTRSLLDCAMFPLEKYFAKRRGREGERWR